MTVRLQLSCGDKTREASFERRSISIGRGPFNDIVFAEADLGRVHGALKVDEDGGLVFRTRASSLPTRIFRDGECRDYASGESEKRMRLEPGEILQMGHSPVVALEVLEVSFEPSVEWSLIELSDLTDLETSEPTASLFFGLSRRLTQSPGVRSFLECAAILAAHLVERAPSRLELALPVETSPWRSDDHSLIGVELDVSRSPGELVEADVGGDYGQARDPLPTFGGERAAMLEELRSLERCVVLCEEVSAQQLLIPLTFEGELAGVVELHYEGSVDDRLEELAEVAAFLQPLGAVVVGRHRQSRRCGSFREENHYWRERQRRRYLFKDLVAESEAMRRVYDDLNDWVELDKPVLLLGEAGSGKALLARALHHLGPRRDQTLISINCRELSADRLDFELFGTVANDLSGEVEPRKGIFELADRGTVVLREVDQLSLVLQGKLVRMLREGEVRRIGDAFARRVETRLVASTHRDLSELVERGKFRRELHLALNEYVLEVPPLRERKEDILPLARTFLKRFAERYERCCRRLSPAVEQKLLGHRWPGNIRELKSVIEAGVLHCDGEEITPRDLVL